MLAELGLHVSTVLSATASRVSRWTNKQTRHSFSQSFAICNGDDALLRALVEEAKRAALDIYAQHIVPVQTFPVQALAQMTVDKVRNSGVIMSLLPI